MAPGGYAWWYLDAISDDARHGLTLIAFVGSVFSPYYHWSGRGSPENHVAINVALYGPHARWAMTERGAGALSRSAAHFSVGPSALTWREGCLHITLDERCTPPLQRIRGTITLRPQALNTVAFTLDAAGRHTWRVIAPSARVEAAFETPALSWRGAGYLDHNKGAEPLEQGFRAWTWSRAHVGADTVVLYDAEPRSGPHASLSLRFDASGAPHRLDPNAFAAHRLPGTLWGVARATRADKGAPAPRLRATWEDTPFYNRSLIETHLIGQPALAVHEGLDLNRLRSPAIRLLLPFRMPREGA